MNPNKLLLLTAVLFIAFSCKKSGNAPVEEEKKAPKKLLVKITEVPANPANGGTIFTNLTYDASYRLINQKSSRQELKYSYNLNRLFQVESANATVEFIYESGLLKKINSRSRTANPIVFDLVLSYQGTKLVHTERVEDKVVIFKEDLQYTGDNVSTSIREDGKYVYKYELAYDDKKNINVNLGGDVLLGMALSGNQFLSLNNVKSEKYTLMQDGKVLFSINTTYVYTYDDEGYPLTCLKKLQHSSLATATETSFAYEYKVVE